jgi:hypothetical protein
MKYMHNSECARLSDDSCRNSSVFCGGRKSRNAARRCRLYERSRARLGTGSVGSHRGALDLRWDRRASYSRCAGFGVPAHSRPASAVLRAESAVFSDFETIRPKSFDHRASLVRATSLETGFALESRVQEAEPQASTSRDLLSTSVFSSTENSLH